jgi:tetratricopeptide (TPR) repeat protein
LEFIVSKNVQSWLGRMLCLAAIVILVASLAMAAAPAGAVSASRDLLSAGRLDDAIQSLQLQVNQSSASAESYNLLCRAYFMAEDWDRGITACERARELDPHKGDYYMWLGRVYGEKADHSGIFSAAGLAKKVRTYFERAVELDPSNSEARTDLAEFYMEAPGIVGGGIDKARRQADAIMPLNPAAAHWVQGRIAEKQNDKTAAEREYRAEIAASHNGARAWMDLASFLRRTQRWNEMEQALENIASGSVDRPEALMDGAHMLLRSGRDFPLAERLLRRYLASPVEAGPAFKAHDMLGQLLEKEGNLQAAANEYRSALELAHGYAKAQENLRRVEHGPQAEPVSAKSTAQVE